MQVKKHQKKRKKRLGNISKEKSAIYRNMQQIKENYLIVRIEDKGRASWMAFIECLRKYCQVHHFIILYVLQCATVLCEIVFNINKVD
jgi:Fe2+ or Zn2+ uptake regulation protein